MKVVERCKALEMTSLNPIVFAPVTAWIRYYTAVGGRRGLWNTEGKVCYDNKLKRKSLDFSVRWTQYL